VRQYRRDKRDDPRELEDTVSTLLTS
jgi:hypothetical protein